MGHGCIQDLFKEVDPGVKGALGHQEGCQPNLITDVKDFTDHVQNGESRLVVLVLEKLVDEVAEDSHTGAEDLVQGLTVFVELELVLFAEGEQGLQSRENSFLILRI